MFSGGAGFSGESRLTSESSTSQSVEGGTASAVFEPAEALRVIAALELVATTLERGLFTLPALPPIAASVYLAESGLALLRVRKLQLAVALATGRWLATEGHLVAQANALLHEAAVMAAGTAVGWVARLLPSGGAGAGNYRVSANWTTSAPAPRNLTALMSRLDSASRVSGGVRIETYRVDNHREFVIYLPGTQNWKPSAGGNPFSLISDLRLYSGGKLTDTAPAMTAVRKLLSHAGVGSKPGDSAIFVGHSQGALVGARLAASGTEPYRVRALITAGGPMGMVALPKTTALVALEHRADPVPLLDLTRPAETKNSVVAKLPDAGSGSQHLMPSYIASAQHVETGGYSKTRRLTEQILQPLQAAGRPQVTQWSITEP